MTPFFTGLIERATLRATGLERRPRSLFEPAAANGGVAIAGVLQTAPDGLDDHMDPAKRNGSSMVLRRELATAGDPIARAPRLDSSADAARSDRSALADAVFSPARQANHEPSLASATMSPRGEIEPVGRFEAHRDELEAVTRLDTTPPTARRAQRLASGTPLPAIPSRASAQPSLTRSDGVPREPSHAREAAAAETDRPAVVLAPSTPVAPPAGTSAPLLRSGPRIPVPPAVIVQSASGSVPRTTGGIAPAPVQVTIGRVEVRASAPAVERPPARRSPAGPRMTLDDYLNGRRRGSR